MKLQKKDILLAIKKNLTEMPMKFDTDDSRPHQDVQTDLANRNTAMKKVNFPKDTEEPHTNFEEFLASKSYKNIVSNVQRYTGGSVGRGEDQRGFELNKLMQRAAIKVNQIEGAHREELARLALQLVMKEFGIQEGDIEYEAKIDMPDNSGFSSTSPNEGPETEEEVEIEKELFNDLESFNLERAKRRLINAMMAGSSERGHYMFHLVDQELSEITGSDELINLYGILMSISNSNLWQISNRNLSSLIGGAGGGQASAGGKERVDLNSNPPKVYATAINFPILVHELIKGTKEVVAGLHGLPKDRDMAQRVIDAEDKVDKELWDLRLGPAIWDIVRESLPEEVLTDENKKELQLIFFQHIVSKPPKEFLVFMKELLSGSSTGKRLMAELSQGINQMLNDYDYEEAMNKFDEDLNTTAENEDEDGLDDFLSSLGIGRSNDDD
jgi:hypothetical protein